MAVMLALTAQLVPRIDSDTLFVADIKCIRMFNRDVEALYRLVPEGTAVFIY